MRKSLLLVFALISYSFAGEPADSQAYFHIQPLDPSLKADGFTGFKDPRIRVHPALTAKRSLPSVQDRDRLIHNAGLEEDVAHWDQLDRDLLYIKAKRASEKELAAAYPKLDEGKLRHLSQMIQGEK